VVIGAGTSPLVGLLAAEGFDVVAVDVSGAAIDALRAVVADATTTSADFEFLVADVRTLRLDPQVDAWHDRAVFHFFVEEADQAAYVNAASASIRVGGHLVIATFAPDGPQQCSGLAVQRHDAASLGAAFGGSFEVIESFEAGHETPWGAVQRFTHAVLRRIER
jgi:SAM-dependent methyltransferase